MTLTTAAIEAMGFRQPADPKELNAAFYSFHVYEVRGFTMDGDPLVFTRNLGPITYALGVGISINAITRSMMGDDYTVDEEQWRNERKCTPPFLLVRIGPTTTHTASAPYQKQDEDGGVITYNAFASARDELRRIEADALPSIETALTCVLNTSAHTVRLRHIDACAFGLAESGQIIKDVRIIAHGAGYASRRFTSDELRSSFDRAAHVATTLKPKVARIYQLGLRTDDPLKRFLYFFLATEIEVNRAYSQVDHAERIEQIMAVPDTIRASAMTSL